MLLAPRAQLACRLTVPVVAASLVRVLRALGADLAGMSTVLEVIAARQMGLAVLCLSLVANPAAGLAAAPLTHEEVLSAAEAGSKSLRQLLNALIENPDLIE